MRVIIYLLTCAIIIFNVSIAVEMNDARTKNYHHTKKTLLSAWCFLEPYQYNQISGEGYRLTGMDIELTRALANKIALGIDYEKLDWSSHLESLRKGEKDIASGSTYSEFRKNYAHFSEPYRYEENSLFIKKDNEAELTFTNLDEFLYEARLKNFILGVSKAFVYADEKLNFFIKDQSNQDIIKEYDNDMESLNALIRGDIDGFLADRVVGAAAVMHKKLYHQTREIPLNIKVPIHFMFSKKTVPVELVAEFNQNIKDFKNSNEYKQIVKSYLYPVMLMQTVESKWFYYLGIIGTISFAISAVAISVKNNITLFGTIVIATIPAIGGGIIRDIVSNRQEVGIFLAPSYVYCILVVVLSGFLLVRIFTYYNKRAHEDFTVRKFWKNILTISDAAGQSAFITTGVAVAVISKIQPIELWGPFIAFLAASCGSIIRDMLLNKGEVNCLQDEINIEVTILWGFLFSIFLDLSSYDPCPDKIKTAVIITVVGSFLTKILCHYFKVPNIYFKPKTLTTNANIIKISKNS